MGDQKLAILSVTKRCNLCCAYCRTEDMWYDVLGQKSKVVDLPKEKWIRALDHCREVGEVLITGGEPVEYPLFKEFLRFLAENKIRFSLHTNGVSKKWSDVLVYFQNNNLHPDIHLSTELFADMQKEIRGGSKLPLQFIADVKKLNMAVELKITLHQQLLSHIDQLKENLYSWVEKGVDSIFFQPIAPVGKHFPRGLGLDKSFIPFLVKLKGLKAKDPVLSRIIRKSEMGFDTIISLIEGNNFYKTIAEKCRVYDQIIFLNPDLQILNCKTLWDRKKGTSCADFFDFICCGFQP
ncbi:MAG: radical SAM protein [Candidatus Nealsonbacteria bacterium]